MTDESGNNDYGMHPGVVEVGHKRMRVYPLKNTAKRPSRVRLEKALAGWDRHIENNPRDEMAKRCRANCKGRLDSIA